MGILNTVAEKCYYKALDKSVSSGKKIIKEKYKEGLIDEREYNFKIAGSYKNYKNYISKY